MALNVLKESKPDMWHMPVTSNVCVCGEGGMLGRKIAEEEDEEERHSSRRN